MDTSLPPSIKPSYRIPEFCAAFGVGRTRAYEEIAAGRLRAFKIGRATLIAGEDALAWRDRYRAGQP
jgi:hypothetical protein